jgi:hypothetical protein
MPHKKCAKNVQKYAENALKMRKKMRSLLETCASDFDFAFLDFPDTKKIDQSIKVWQNNIIFGVQTKILTILRTLEAIF